MNTKTTWIWVGAPAAIAFVAFKLIGALTCSWWWILPLFFLVCKRNKN